MATAVERCDAYLAYLTPHSLYLEAPVVTRPALDEEFIPVMRRRRRTLSQGGPARPVVIAVTHGLGDPRTDAPEIVRRATGEDISTLWTIALDQTTERITLPEAANLAKAALAAVLPPGEGPESGDIDISVVTRGTGQPPAFLTVDGSALLGGNGRRPGQPQDWERFLRGLRDLESVIAAWTRSRNLHLDPRTHLTGAVTLGRVFNQAAHWYLRVRGRAGAAEASTAASHEGLSMSWERFGVGGDLLAHIDLLGHPVGDLATMLAKDMPALSGRLEVTSPAPTGELSSADLSTMASESANALRRAATEARPSRLHLAVAAPAEFCVLLGHRLTALHADLHLYERDDDRYVGSLVIPANTP